MKITYLLFGALFSFGYIQGVAAQYFEFGAKAGVAQYFGDINPNFNFKTPQPVAAFFFRHNFHNRFAMKYSLGYARLSSSDALSRSTVQRQRNLSFRTDILDISAQVEIHFLNYVTEQKWGRKGVPYTPYLIAGISVFYYNPKANLEGQWYELQPLGTEGQNDEAFTGRKPYQLVNFSIPLGLGFKYSITKHWTLGIEAIYRMTFTDYLDDVSTTYVSNLSFEDGPQSIAARLADRSAEVGTGIGAHGRFRGDAHTKDQYLSLGFTFSYTIVKRRCPSPSRIY